MLFSGPTYIHFLLVIQATISPNFSLGGGGEMVCLMAPYSFTSLLVHIGFSWLLSFPIPYHFLLLGLLSTLKMVAVNLSETSVNLYLTTWCHIPKYFIKYGVL
jgi:hypothetical protein